MSMRLLRFYVICELFVFLQYFDTVGWVFWPVKTVSRITYTVLVETLNHAQSNSYSAQVLVVLFLQIFTEIYFAGSTAQVCPLCVHVYFYECLYMVHSISSVGFVCACVSALVQNCWWCCRCDNTFSHSCVHTVL